MTYKYRTITALAAVVALTACSGSEAGTHEGSPSGGTPMELERVTEEAPSQGTTLVLASVPTANGEVEFVQHVADNGDTFIYVQEHVIKHVNETSIGRVLREHELTNLELFLALAPGRDVPRELEEAHAGHARQLGRQDVSVRHFDVELDQPIEKLTATQCSDWIFADTSSSWDWTNKVYGEGYGYTYAPVVNATYRTSKNVTLGFCAGNSNTGNIKGRFGHRPDSNSDIVWAGWTPNQSAGGGWRWYNFNKIEVVNCGLACWLPTIPHYRIEIMGNDTSATYYTTRTAERSN